MVHLLRLSYLSTVKCSCTCLASILLGRYLIVQQITQQLYQAVWVCLTINCSSINVSLHYYMLIMYLQHIVPVSYTEVCVEAFISGRINTCSRVWFHYVSPAFLYLLRFLWESVRNSIHSIVCVVCFIIFNDVSYIPTFSELLYRLYADYEHI